MKRILIALAFLSFVGINTSWATEDIDHARGIHGLLSLPELFGAYPCEHFTAKDIKLYRSPNAAAHFGRIYVSKPWTYSPLGGCEGLDVSVEIFDPARSVEPLPSLEFSYENPSAIVRSRQEQWFEIALNHDYAWIHVDDADARYLAIEKLLVGSLAYLRGHRPLNILNEPAIGKEVLSQPIDTRDNPSVDVIEFRNVAGELWVRVKVLDADPCSGEATGVMSVTGWVRFHDEDGMPTIWFFSRGC